MVVVGVMMVVVVMVVVVMRVVIALVSPASVTTLRASMPVMLFSRVCGELQTSSGTYRCACMLCVAAVASSEPYSSHVHLLADKTQRNHDVVCITTCSRQRSDPNPQSPKP